MPFPGVETRVIDQSFFTTSFSRFRAGLVGVAEKGPFNSLVPVSTVQDFVRQFGTPVSGAYLADAVALVSQTSDGCRVVRVGAQYEELVDGAASGTKDTYELQVEDAELFDAGDYVRVRQVGKATTVNAEIDSVGSNSLTLVSTGSSAVALAATYAGADVDSSTVENAANEAESFLMAPSWVTVAAAGSCTGTKNTYEITISGDPDEIEVGDVLRISQTDRDTTREVRVAQVRADKRVLFDVVNETEVGYQALPLQDSYTAGVIERASDLDASVAIHLKAASAGTWANTVGGAGLRVLVAPGFQPDTKKFLVYSNGSLVETIDNLAQSSSSDDYYVTRINDLSSYISVVAVVDSVEPPTNTWNPWNLVVYSRVNYTAFTGGFNGENATTADIIGTVDPEDDTPTGLKVLQDPDTVDVDMIAVPGNTTIAVFQELARIAQIINAVAIVDVPDALNARAAIDWLNGAGLYTANGKIDNYRVAAYWNWWTMTDTFSGTRKKVPPSLAALRAFARTFDQAKPWSAAAGEVRGAIPEALSVVYTAIAQSVKDAMYGNGNSVNPILLNRGRIMVFGERTLQRADSKLTAVHNVVLINTILKSFATIARRYIFDPNDATLLNELRLGYTNYLESLKSERGIEEFLLIIDETNNTAQTRNERRVVIDLVVIPLDVVERFQINAVVEESGAQLIQVN